MISVLDGKRAEPFHLTPHSSLKMVEALAAQGSTKQIHILNSVILLVSIASAFGAAWMIISFCVSLAPAASS